MNKNQFNQQNVNYPSVTIGNQVWMAENLNVDTFRNGDPIPHAKTDDDWEAADEQGKPAWCYYDNDPENGKKYGKLYNWYAVNDPRGLAPEGWKIPSDKEWTILTDYLGGEHLAGNKLKSTSGWDDVGNGNDEFGFSALPGGRRWDDGNFYDLGTHGTWWSSIESSSTRAWYRRMSRYGGGLRQYYYSKTGGFSLRCIRDID